MKLNGRDSYAGLKILKVIGNDNLAGVPQNCTWDVFVLLLMAMQF
jgi:hypothetical protein